MFLWPFLMLSLLFDFCFLSTMPRDWLEEHLQNDIVCVEWDVKP